MKKAIGIFTLGYIFGGLSLWIAEPWHPLVVVDRAQAGQITEQVELAHTRTRLRHEDCRRGGFWKCCGQPKKVEGGGVFGADVLLWPHKCDACGATNVLFNVRYPQIKGEWRTVK